MKDEIHNTVVVDSSKDRAVLLSLGDIQKALSENKKGVKVNISQLLWYWRFQDVPNDHSKMTIICVFIKWKENMTWQVHVVYNTQ